MYNAQVRTLTAALSDQKMLVLSNDLADIATASTDFIFDASNPAGYLGGALPAVGAAAATSAIVSGVTITNPGSGGTNGTFALIFSGGGGGAGAAGTFTVAGGVLTDITITNGGSGYTAMPVINFGNSVGLTGAGYQVQLGSILNLVKSSSAVTLWPSTNAFASAPLFDGKGWSFANGSTIPLQVAKHGTPLNRVCEPTLEGFVDFLEIAWCKPSAYVSNAAPYRALTNAGGFFEGGAVNSWYLPENSISIAPIAFGSLVQLAKLIRFNVGANTSTITPFVNGVKGAPIAGKTPSAYGSNVSGVTTCVGGDAASVTHAMTGSVYRVVRDLVGRTGLTDDEVAAIVNRDFAYGAARFA